MTALAHRVETSARKRALIEFSRAHEQGDMFGKPRAISEIWQSHPFPPQRGRAAARREVVHRSRPRPTSRGGSRQAHHEDPTGLLPACLFAAASLEAFANTPCKSSSL